MTDPTTPLMTDEQITSVYQKYGTSRPDGFESAARAIESAVRAPLLADIERLTRERDEARAELAAAQAQAEPVQRVYLVYTGETHNGQETYTRHDDAPPPLCDAECLYTAPQPAAQPVRNPLTEAQALAAFNADSHGCFADFLGGVRFAERARLAEPVQPVAVPAMTPGYVPVPPQVVEDAPTALGHFVSDEGWDSFDMQAMDNLDAHMAQHKARTAAAPKGGA